MHRFVLLDEISYYCFATFECKIGNICVEYKEEIYFQMLV